MITEIREDVVQLWETMRVPNGALDKFRHVQAGDENLMGDYYPAVTFDYDNHLEIKPNGNHYEARFRFKASMYSASLGTLKEGATAHLQLLCRSEGGKLLGLAPATVKLSLGFTTDAGQAFKVRMDEATKSFAIKGKRHQHWSFVTEMRVWFETWLNAEQIASLT